MPARRWASHAFVLRVWREDDKDGNSWRGWIQHVGSGEKRYLHEPEEILSFVQEHVNPGVGEAKEDDSCNAV